VALRNLEIAFPEKNLEDRESIAKGSFENLGRVLGELTQFPKATHKSLRDQVVFEFESEENRNSPKCAWSNPSGQKAGVCSCSVRILATGRWGSLRTPRFITRLLILHARSTIL
jgi:hypothetical protein